MRSRSTIGESDHIVVTPHGLRATFRTWGEDVGFPRELLEEALGPSDRDGGGTSVSAHGQLRAPPHRHAGLGGLLPRQAVPGANGLIPVNASGDLCRVTATRPGQEPGAGPQVGQGWIPPR